MIAWRCHDCVELNRVVAFLMLKEEPLERVDVEPFLAPIVTDKK